MAEIRLRAPFILGSTSPRRQFLLKEIGFRYQLERPHEDESFAEDMNPENVPGYLARKKAQSLQHDLSDRIILTADTVVVLGNKILNKPFDRDDAIRMLSDLAGATHTVITAVCILSPGKMDQFEDRTAVTFNKLTQDEIKYYVDNHKPFDKAGAYGAQEFLPKGMNPCSADELEFLKSINKTELVKKSMNAGTGIAGIERIQGSYFNVMGLPVRKVYEHLARFQVPGDAHSGS